MGLFDFLKRKKGDKTKSVESDPAKGGASSSSFEQYTELEEFLYLANKMIINNKASTDTSQIKAFIKDTCSETDLNTVKEEIKYFMFCLLHFYTFQEVAVYKKILDLKDEKALKHFKSTIHNSLERAFLTSLNDFEYNIEKYNDRYGKYTQYLGKYNYENFERSFVECFAMQLTDGFADNPNPVSIDATQLLSTAQWVYRAYGESTKLTLSRQNFIL